jgi:hypothetical protein
MISIKLLKSGVFRQSYAVLCVNLLTLVYGAANGEFVSKASFNFLIGSNSMNFRLVLTNDPHPGIR